MVTIYEVAQKAGVSPKTAARILSGAQGRPHNRQRVMTVAKKLGYVRNQQAANLRSGKSGLIGIVVPDIRNPFYPLFFQTVHDACVTRGYQVLLSSTFGTVTDEVHALRMCETNRVEGIILNVSEGQNDERCDEIIDRFIHRGVHLILAGRAGRGLQADEIVIRNEEAVAKAVAYLQRTGHSDIAFIGGSEDSLATSERLSGFKKGMKAAGLETSPSGISFGAFTFDSGYRQATPLLGTKKRPTAIVAANDLIATGVLKAAFDLRISVPRSLAVVGFDDIPLAQMVAPALTTLKQPQETIARDAVKLLIDRIRGEDTSAPRKLVYEPELIIRQTA